MNRLCLLLCALLISLPAGAPASADSHCNLDPGQPVQATDAFPLPANVLRGHGSFRWDRQENETNKYILESGITYGLMTHCQAHVTLPFAWGSAQREEGLEAVTGGVLFDFFHEQYSEWTFAFSGDLMAPAHERENQGLDYKAGILATYTVPQTRRKQRFHLNGAVWHNTNALKKQRRNYFGGILAYDIELSPRALFITDFVRQASIWKGAGTISNCIEAGIRQKVGDAWTVSYGAGVGLGESPEARYTAGAAYSF